MFVPLFPCSILFHGATNLSCFVLTSFSQRDNIEMNKQAEVLELVEIWSSVSTVLSKIVLAYQININWLQDPNWQKADQLAINKAWPRSLTQDRLLRTNHACQWSQWQDRGLKLGTSGLQSVPLTTRQRSVFLHLIHVTILALYIFESEQPLYMYILARGTKGYCFVYNTCNSKKVFSQMQGPTRKLCYFGLCTLLFHEIRPLFIPTNNRF